MMRSGTWFRLRKSEFDYLHRLLPKWYGSGRRRANNLKLVGSNPTPQPLLNRAMRQGLFL